jgi:hypothetical protein
MERRRSPSGGGMGYSRAGPMAPSLLSRISADDVVAEPFPHVIARDVLDASLCDTLVAEFPPDDLVADGQPARSNRRFSYSASKAIEDIRLSRAWRDFIRTHVSQGFLDDLMRVFGDHVGRLYPELRRDRPLRAGVRYADSFDRADVLLDAQACINTPVTGPSSSVRPVHVDEPWKLFAGLFYLRHPGDDSRGGDLELYRLRGRTFAFHAGPYIAERYVERVATVKYERNVLVVFVNSLRSLHGVSVRHPTPWTRRFFNLVAEVGRPLFDLDRHQETIVGKVIRRSGRLLRR